MTIGEARDVVTGHLDHELELAGAGITNAFQQLTGDRILSEVQLVPAYMEGVAAEASRVARERVLPFMQGGVREIEQNGLAAATREHVLPLLQEGGAQIAAVAKEVAGHAERMAVQAAVHARAAAAAATRHATIAQEQAAAAVAHARVAANAAGDQAAAAVAAAVNQPDIPAPVVPTPAPAPAPDAVAAAVDVADVAASASVASLPQPIHELALSQLVGMGFDEASARAALEQHHYNVAAAVTALLGA
jgi:hypothetical protein